MDTCRRYVVPVGLSPNPFPTAPLFFKSIFQVSSSPALFLSTKANTALPVLMAFLRSASDELRAALMTSKASEEGNAAVSNVRTICWKTERMGRVLTVLERHVGG